MLKDNKGAKMTKLSEAREVITKLIKDEQERLDKFDWGMNKGHIEYCENLIKNFKFILTILNNLERGKLLKIIHKADKQMGLNQLKHLAPALIEGVMKKEE